MRARLRYLIPLGVHDIPIDKTYVLSMVLVKQRFLNLILFQNYILDIFFFFH